MSGGLLALEDARARVLASAGPALPSELVDLDGALGRVLAEPVVAASDLPPWDSSAMDGYAIRHEDVAGAADGAPVRLRVTGEAAAGATPRGVVTAGGAIRIATGAPVPAGSTAVVAVELTTPIGADGGPGARGRDATGPLPEAILVHEATAGGANIRARAGDLAAGRQVLGAGRALGPAEIALAAAAGAGRLAVHRRPRVAVLATGDELRPAGEELGPAGIPDSNGPALVALCRAAGAEARHSGIAPDRLDAMLDALHGALADSDLVVVSGGVSVGPYDVVKRAFEAVGSVDLWRVAVQPGKPFAFGVAAGERGPVLLFGLPGNPVSSFVTFELFVRPTLRRLSGRADGDLLRPVDRGVLDRDVPTSAGRRTFLRARSLRDATGTPLRDAAGNVRLELAGRQESHVLTALAAADALAVVPESVEVQPAGVPVEVWWLDRA